VLNSLNRFVIFEMQKRATTRKQKRNKRKRPAQDGINATANSLVKMPRSPQLIISDRIYTKLTFGGFANLTIAAATAVIARRYTPSAAYDVDPLVGSTAMPGFAEFAALYNLYRVTTSRITVEFANQSTSAIKVCVIPLNSDPGSAPSSAVVDFWMLNPYSKVKVLSPVGSPTEAIRSSMSTEKIFGSKAVYFDDTFAAQVTGIPNNNWFWAIGLQSPVVAAGNLLIAVNIVIDIGLEFYERKYVQA